MNINSKAFIPNKQLSAASNPAGQQNSAGSNGSQGAGSLIVKSEQSESNSEKHKNKDLNKKQKGGGDFRQPEKGGQARKQ